MSLNVLLKLMDFMIFKKFEIRLIFREVDDVDLNSSSEGVNTQVKGGNRKAKVNYIFPPNIRFENP